MEKRYILHKCVVLLSLLLFCLTVKAVPVHINSGNPAYPFPQFLEYACGVNLGTQNPEGVVHIEMEQDIRDAYQIFANEWEYTGETMDGVKYIRGNIGCPYDCREGDGYSMLAAAVMGDKQAFDGLWFRIHDRFRPTATSYLTGAKVADGGYGNLIIGDQANSCSATDGDNEIVLALYIAWRQWGDDSGHKGANGEMISYKKDMIEVVRGLVAMYEERFKTENPRRVTTGDVGLDGYLKNGTTWSEVTGWATTNALNMNGVSYIPEYAGPVKMHTDYSSPAYFREFYDLVMELDLPESSDWEREQYRRCEASCDWMVGNWLSQSAKNLFFGEEASISNNNVVTLSAGNQGGRFRSAWRTALNYVWHLNPDYTWDPVSHTVKDGGNTFEKDWCDRFAKFMNDPQGWNNSSACTEFGGGPSVSYKGPATLHWDIGPDGSFPKSEFIFNWISGVGMPAAIGSGDMDLAGVLYRQCNIEWDITEGGDGYLTSVPHYFHGFFRWLGMVIATGNHQAPSVMKPSANMKIYRAIEDSVTFAYTGDEIKYLLDYRNFGTIDAKDVVIVENVPKDFVFLSASDGGVYDAATHTITWKIGTVPGFKSDNTEGPALNLKSGNLAKTIGQVSYKCKIGPKAFGRYCTTADITCSNGTGWTSNEYPNYTTATMQRNCVDVIKRALKIEKTSDVEKVNPGNLVKYQIDFENSSEAGWLDGGRPRVSVAVSNSGLGTSQQWLRFRLYNDAIEPYINYGNYRIAYYMYDSGLDCLAGEDDCPVGWGWYTAVYEGKRTPNDKVSVTHETIVEGSDDFGKWNQRLCIQFAPLLVTTTAHLSNYYGMGTRIHKGGTEPLRVFGYLYPSNWANTNFADDWSWDANAQDAEDGNYHPISPSWQNIDPETGKSIEIPVTEYLPSICEKPKHVVKNILVEEYDGYVWRRILGTGPMAGREAKDVVVVDTLPKGMEFVGFQNECPLAEYGASWKSSKIADGRWVVKWEIPIMQVKQKGSIIYTAMASFPSGATCETDDELTQNVAWILADKNSPLSDTAEVTVTCGKVPKPIVPTTLVKSVDKETVQVDDEVTYTIEYEQTHGAIYDDALSKSSDWSLSGASISGGTLSISQNTKATYNNSLSKNIYVEMDANIAADQTGEIILRDNIRLQFKYNTSNGMTVTCYDGSREVEHATCALKNNPSRWSIKLQDDVLQVWFGKDTSASASFSASGLTEKEGKLAFNGAGWGDFKYSNMHVHTDYAYNLSIVDLVPAEIKVDESSFQSFHNGTAAGTGKLYKGADGDSIVWTSLASNPIAFGDKFKVTWTGKVVDCSEKVINLAKAKLLGHDDDEIMAQAVSVCGASCDLTSVTMKPDANDVCGDSVVLRVDAKSSGIYNYEYYLNGSKIGSTTKMDTFVAKVSGNYSVIVTDPSDATCTLTSSDVTVVIKERPEGADYAIGLLCEGMSSANNSDYQKAVTELSQKESNGYSVLWYNAAGQSLSQMPNPDNETVSGEYNYVYTLEKDGCVSDEMKLSYTVSDTAKLDLKDLFICAGQSATLETPYDASYTYKWSDGSSNNTLVTDQAGTYSVVVTTTAGCESHASAKVTVADKLEVDLGDDKTVCKADLPYVLDATSNYDSFEWSDGTTEQTLNVTETGTYKVKVTQGTCSGEGEVTITVSTVDDPVVDHVITYMASDTTSAGIFSKSLTQQDATAVSYASGTTPKWYDENKNELQMEPIPAVPAGGGNASYTYYTSAVNADGCESGLVAVTVTVSGAPAPTVANADYCLNDPEVTTLMAKATPSADANETWTLKWYDASGTALNEAPTPSVTTVGETTYYVSQVSDLTGAESGKTALKVTVYGTAEPSVAGNKTSYCSGDTYEPLQVTSNADASQYLMPGKMVWTMDGTEVTGTPTIPQSESVIFTVREDYEIAAGHVCMGTPVVLVVTTTTVEKPTGDMTVNYLKKEGEGGMFPSLTDKNANVAKASTGNKLVWYDANKNELGSTAPSPAYDNTWAAGTDQTLTYYVAQTDGICTSELVEVTVNISDSPMPRTSAIAYCQNDISQPLTAEVNDDMEAASNYELVWYDPTTGAELTSAPTPLTDVPGEYTYNVAQRHITTQATSSPSVVKVTIHKLPELTTTMPEPQCGGSVVLSNYIKEKNGMIVTQNYYEDAAKSVAASAVATKSGTYYSDAYYTIGTGIQCKSSTVSVEVSINDLTDLMITGPTTTCPGGSVELTASATSVDPGIVTYRWEVGGGTSGGEKLITPELYGDYGTVYIMTVYASAGACLDARMSKHTVTIDRGVLTGAMTMNGETTKLYKTCGDESITIETSHSGTDYSWSTLDGTPVSGTTSIEVTPTQTTTYVLSLTNVCATSDTVTVEVHPLSVTADWTKLNTTICEGEAFSAELSMTGYDASASGAYIKWYKGDEELTSHANKQTLSVSAGQASDGGVYRYEVSNGVCSMPKEGTTDTGELTVVEKATYTKTEGAVSCSGEEVEIAVTANESDAIVTWADDASAGATRTVNPTENTTYKFSVTRQTVCVSEDEVTVSVKEKPEVKVEDVNICAGDKTTLKAETSGDDLTNQGWITSAGDTIMTRTLAIATDSTTSYTAFVESQSCGSAQATMTVTVIPLPELQIDSIGLTSREVSVVGGSSAYYEYKVDNGQWQSTGHFETLTYLLHTAYAKDEYGCQGSLMFEVVAPPVVIPEVFTPEGDGVNDEWDLTNILDAYPNSVVKVFDRYGKQVAELKGDVESWDGTYNGRPLPSTDYWYTINIPEIDRVYSGHFTLIRSK